MWPPIFTAGKFELTWWGIWLIVMFLVGSFMTWRSLRESYSEEEILSLWVIMSTMGIVGSILSGFLIYRNIVWWPWGGIGGIIVTLIIWSLKKGWNFWEGLDSLSLVVMLGAVGVAIGWGRAAFGLAGFLLTGLLIVFGLPKWKRHIELGIMGLLALFWFGISQVVVAIKLPGGVYWGPLELSQYVGIVVVVSSIVVISWRSGFNIWPAKKTIKRQ